MDCDNAIRDADRMMVPHAVRAGLAPMAGAAANTQATRTIKPRIETVIIQAFGPAIALSRRARPRFGAYEKRRW